ncbi:hypothetical protein ACIA8F_23505 [Streptomyces sp. NPDC051563]|uniref:hypothetical protein n=1 Tax=Streptomyces sp. NPDC051563 TaxID=3365659 RepID=UPI0037991F20
MSDQHEIADLMPLSVAYIGYARAVIRLRLAVEGARPEEDGIVVLATATEALFWACAVAENLDHDDPTYDQADKYGKSVVQGARWARNQATHQLAFVVADAGGNGLSRVVWRPVDQLPEERQERAAQRKQYRANLEGKPILDTFATISGFFASEQLRVGSLLQRATGSESI